MHEKGTASERNNVTIYANKLKRLISKKVHWYVSTLLPFKVQQFIIVFTFECQKSFVLKERMVNFNPSDVNIILKYIFNPNTYAEHWLVTFTDEIKKISEKNAFVRKICKR